MNDGGKIFVQTCLKAIREFPNMWYFYLTEEESLNL